MLKVGIVGTGGIADTHIRGYLEFLDECEIVALADIVPGKAAATREAFALTDAAAYDDPAALLSAGIDVVSITTPPSSHAQLTIDFLRAGVNVIVEKPMAPSLEECDAMIAAQRESGKILSPVAQNRFRDDLVTLKEVLESGLLGSISHVQVNSAWFRGRSYYDLWWRGTWQSEGGGCTLNHAIHHIDLTLWLLGAPKAVASMLTNAQHDNAEVEDLSVAILEYDRALAELNSSVVHHGEEQAIVVQAEHARVSQPWRVVAERAQPNGFPAPGGNPELVAAIEKVAAAHVALSHESHAGQIGDVLAAIREGRAPAISGEDGRNAVELVTGIYQAGIERRTVDFPLQPDNPYYRTGTLIARAPHFFEKTNSVHELVGDIIVGASTDAA